MVYGNTDLTETEAMCLACKAISCNIKANTNTLFKTCQEWLMTIYLGGEAGGVQKACAAGKCCFLRAWIRLGRYSGSTHQREPFPLACREK